MRFYIFFFIFSFFPLFSFSQIDSAGLRRGNLLFESADSLLSLREYESSAAKFLQSARAFKEANAIEREGRAYYNLASVYYYDYQDSACLASMRKAIDLFRQSKNKSSLGSGYLRYGTYLKGTGQNDSAEASYKRALAIGESLNDSTLMAYAYNNLGTVYETMGRYKEATEVLYKSLEIRELARIKTSGTLLNLGNTLDLLGFNEESFQTYKKALAAKIAEQDSMGAARVLANIAVIYKNREQYDSAILMIERSNELLLAVGNEIELYTNYTNLGNLYKRQGKNQQALELLNAALEIAQKTNNKNRIGDTYQNLGTYYFDLGQYPDAINYFGEALRLTDYTKSNAQLHEINFKLYEAYNALKQPANALQYLVTSNQYRDSLFRFEQIEAIEELKTAYETEKKEQQIEIQNAQLVQQELQLERDRYLLLGLAILVVLLVVIGSLYRSRMQARARERLEATRTRAREAQIQAIIDSQEKERNRFARDLHDTFGQLISTLNIHIQQVKERDTITREDRQLVFEESSQILDDMYRELKNVCFDLMPQTLIKSGISHALREFADRVNHTGKFHVSFDQFGLEDRLPDVVEVSLYRITQEWVNNILKYSDAKRIDIQLTRDEREITLTIEDDGLGFDQEKLIQGKGNGWKNITSRTNLIQGVVELDTLPERRGTTLILNAAINSVIEEKYHPQGIES